MLGARDTSRYPEVAPDGIVMMIEVLLQELTVTGTLFKVTKLLPSEEPNAEPVTTTWLPTGPVVAERPVMTGEWIVVLFTETESNVAVVGPDELLP